MSGGQGPMSSECGKEGWAKVRSCLRDLDFCILYGKHWEAIGGPSDQIRSDQSLSRVRLFATP